MRAAELANDRFQARRFRQHATIAVASLVVSEQEPGGRCGATRRVLMRWNPMKQQRCCLIVVEDEALLRLVMEMALREDTDFDFRVVSTVGAALEALDAEAENLDCLVTNVDLGHAKMTGFDLARRARELNPEIFVVYISGGAGHRFEKEKVPGSVFLPKPFDVDRLVAVLRSRCLEENAPEPPEAEGEPHRQV